MLYLLLAQLFCISNVTLRTRWSNNVGILSAHNPMFLLVTNNILFHVPVLILDIFINKKRILRICEYI